MSTDEISPRLFAIEKRLSALQDKRKDFWDKFNIVAALLIPAAIASAGYFFSSSLSQAQIVSAEKSAEQNRAVAEINAHVEQAKLLSTFMEPLVSESPQRRKIAIKAVLIALGNDGREIVETVAQTDADTGIKEYASSALSSLDERRLQLVKNLFADNSQIRIAAADELLRGWHSDSKLIPVLIDAANQNKSNADGTYNAVVILNGVDTNPLLSNRDVVMQFLATAESNGGKKTKILIAQVRARIGS